MIRVVTFVGLTAGAGTSTVVGITASGLAVLSESAGGDPAEVDVIDWTKNQSMGRWWGNAPAPRSKRGTIWFATDIPRQLGRGEAVDRIRYVLIDAGVRPVDQLIGMVVLVVDPVMHTQKQIDHAVKEIRENPRCVLLAVAHNRSHRPTGSIGRVGGVMHVPHSPQAHNAARDGVWPLQADDDPEFSKLQGPAAEMDWLCGEIDHSDITAPRGQPWERVEIKQHAFDLPVDANEKFKAIGARRGRWLADQVVDRYDELADPDNPIVEHVAKAERKRQRIDLPAHVVDQIETLAQVRYCAPWQIVATIINRSPAPRRTTAKRIRY